MTIKELNPYVWFGERKVKTVPKHFVRAPTLPTRESRNWVITMLKGRYGEASVECTNGALTTLSVHFFFEDPAEATMYELRWAGEQNNSLY